MRFALGRWSLLCLCIALMAGATACSAPPRTGAVILWLDGSGGEDDEPDRRFCLTSPRANGAVAALDGATVDGVALAVSPVCQARLAGSHVRERNWGRPKVCARARDLLRRLDEDYAHLPPERIFVAGQSAGAWAALLAKRARPDGFNAALAFAPAFAHKREERLLGAWGADLDVDKGQRWSDMRRRHHRRLEEGVEGRPAPGLVFAFQCDPFERPAELAALVRGGAILHSFPAEFGELECSRPPTIAEYSGERFAFCPGSDDGAGAGGAACGAKRMANCPPGYEALCEAGTSPHVDYVETPKFRSSFDPAIRNFIAKRLREWRPAGGPVEKLDPCAFLDGD